MEGGKKRRWEDATTPEITVEDAGQLIEPFTREQLLDLLKQATVKHSDVLEDVRKLADKDSSRRKLFVRGLGFETTTEAVKTVFSEHGELEDVVVIVDKATGKNKGYGFITYKHADSALNALKEPSKKIDDRMTVSNLASNGPLQQQQQQQQQQLYQQLLVPPVQSIQPVLPIQPIQPFQASQSVLPIQPPIQPIADVTPRKIYVGNVPTDMQSAKLLNYFSKYGEIEEGPLGFDKQTGKSRGFALIVYKTIEGANKALEDPVKSIDGQQLFCKLAAEGQKHKGIGTQSQTLPDSSDLGYKPPVSLNPATQYIGLSHSLINPALGANPTSLAHTGLSHYALSDAALASLSSQNQGLPSATSLSYNHSYNSSTPSSLNRDLLLQGLSSVPSSSRTSLGLSSYGVSPYGTSGYGSQLYSSIGGAASIYGLPSSSSAIQAAAYQGASSYGLPSYQGHLTELSPSARISAGGSLQGMPPYYKP